ncbi:S-layer homology domain-containing protein [bacterium]|nr:S-layer homology domain-containing protein [bacterium]
MKFKKLTLAALIALGISATAVSNAAMAACPCKSETPKVSAPCEKVKTKCNKCHKEKPKCKCQSQSDTNERCAKKAQPTCATCASAQTTDRKDMKQIYGYPNAIYGTNNYVGEMSNSITSSESRLNPNIAGATISSEGSMTGAATQIPYLNSNMDTINGVNVSGEEQYIDGGCPIDIHTENSLDALKRSYEPFDLKSNLKGMTGAAANLLNYFPDVPEQHWASCDIDKLAMNDVVVGYPDKMFKPNRNVSRAEFATMLVKGFNMDNCSLEPKCIFSDVPASNWANPMIAKAVDEQLLKGYPNGRFMPNNNVTRAEALTAMAKGLNNCSIDECKAKEILSKYRDGGRVPSWSQIPIATALENGALSDLPNSDMIMPDKAASRADIASMLQNIRVAGGYDNNPKTANAACPIDTGRQAYLENEEVVKIPTLKLEFLDEINAKSAHVGQRFAATTLEEVTINGQVYPCGSRVNGKVIEVIRPNGCKEKGALKLAFTEIQNGNCKAELPKQILTAQINKTKNPHLVARTLALPFTWAGTLVGTTARTAGGLVSNLGNAVENVSNGVGTALGETSQGQFKAAGRSVGDALVETVKAPIDVTRTALSGTMGLFQTSGDEIAYVVDPKGAKISAVNPKEHITIAFGCANK